MTYGTVGRQPPKIAEAQFKNLLSKKAFPELDAAEVVTTDRLPEPQESDIPDLRMTLQLALTHRPDLLQAETDVENQNNAVRFTKNAVLPQLSTFGLWAGSGLNGASLLGTAGTISSLDQAFGAAFPEYGIGASYFMYLGNRSAQADALRAQIRRSACWHAVAPHWPRRRTGAGS